MSSQLGRLVLVPAVLFVVYSGSAFLLAKVHPAKPEAPKAAATTTSSGNNTGAAAAANAENGKSVYADNCASCHGSAGEGGSGPKLAGTSISPEAARSQIDNGGGSMPAGLVSGTDENDLLAYLDTLFTQAEAATTGTDTDTDAGTTAVAAGDAANGKSVYADSCSSCHGSAGEGGSGPKLAGASISLDAARSQIDNGGGSMPAGLVSGTDEDDLLAYLETIFAQ